MNLFADSLSTNVKHCDLGQKVVLLTGAAGFIGMHTALKLWQEGFCVIALDSFTHFYSVKLKKDRSNHLEKVTSIQTIHGDINDVSLLRALINQFKGFDYIVHLAAQPGVQYSVQYPSDSLDANVSRFMTLLKTIIGFNQKPVKLIYASSSSVYGLNSKMPFEEDDKTEQPAAIYGASKKVSLN